MALTRAQVESVLVGPDKLSGRCGRLMVRVEQYVAASVTLGAIPALADPIAEGIRACGAAAADPTSPTDDEVEAAASGRFGPGCLYDVAELRCLESVRGNIDLPTASSSSNKQEWNDFADFLQNRIDALTRTCRSLYRYRASRAVAGVIDLRRRSSCPEV